MDEHIDLGKTKLPERREKIPLRDRIDQLISEGWELARQPGKLLLVRNGTVAEVETARGIIRFH